jgi:hypothetical protein
MKLLVKCACLFSLAVFCAGGNVLLAQTGAPDSTNKPAAAAPRLIKRFTGKIASLDAQAKTFTVESATNDVVQITSQTRIAKDRKPATFEDLAVGQTVTGAKHQDATGTWVATTVSVAVPKPPTTDPKVQ